MKKFYSFFANIPAGMAFGKLANFVSQYHYTNDNALVDFGTFLAVVVCLALLFVPFCTPFAIDCEEEDLPLLQAIAAFVLAAAAIFAL